MRNIAGARAEAPAKGITDSAVILSEVVVREADDNTVEGPLLSRYDRACNRVNQRYRLP